jgi:uncharacterized protein
LVSQLGLDDLIQALDEIQWYGAVATFNNPRSATWFNADGIGYANALAPIVDAAELPDMDAFEELDVRCQLGLMNDIGTGQVQLDHILPLMKRMEGAIAMLRKTVQMAVQTPCPLHADGRIAQEVQHRREEDSSHPHRQTRVSPSSRCRGLAAGPHVTPHNR